MSKKIWILIVFCVVIYSGWLFIVKTMSTAISFSNVIKNHEPNTDIIFISLACTFYSLKAFSEEKFDKSEDELYTIEPHKIVKLTQVYKNKTLLSVEDRSNH